MRASGPKGCKVTVVMTTRDRKELADRALASALNQTLADVEVIVVDDGSSEPYIPPTNDERVTVLRNETSLGPSAARNRALGRARGEWVMFLDDDDVLVPHMLEVSVEAAEKADLPKPVAALSGAQIVRPDGEVLRTRLPPTLPRGRHFFLEDLNGDVSFQTHATLVAPTEVVRQIGGWDESLPASEHDDFFLRLNAVCSIVGVSEVTYQITAHTGPRLSKAVLERAEGMAKTVVKHRAVFAQHPRRYARYLRTIGITYLRAGKWGPAIAATSRALVVYPLDARSIVWWMASLIGPRPIAFVRRLKGRRSPA